MEDKISKPNHYTWHPAGVETYQVAQEFSYNVGTAIAYLWRHRHKGTPVEDLRKAAKHIEFELGRLDVNSDSDNAMTQKIKVDTPK